MDRPNVGRTASRGTTLEEKLRLHQRIVERDRSAVLEWLDRIGDVVYCAARLRTENVGAAEDLIEALFLELWGEPTRFHPRTGPSHCN